MANICWNSLPQHILTDIFSFLPFSDRFHASLVCHAWNGAFHVSYLWSKFVFRFRTELSRKTLRAIDEFGVWMKDIRIEVDQSVVKNRTAACSVLSEFSRLPERRLKRLKIIFVGENPTLYASQEFPDALSCIFGPAADDVHVINTLTHVDLSGLNVTLDGKLLEVLAENNNQLESLNIQNKVLICMVSPTNMLHVVQRCHKLRELHVFNCSLSDEVLTTFMEDDRLTLDHLSIYFRREDKLTRDISADVWKKLNKKYPQLKVTLGFDHTCPLVRISEAMRPEIPVYVLRLETFTSLSNEIQQATSYYKKTLEKLVANCPTTRTTQALDDALLELSANCLRLRSLHVFCLLEKNTVETILKAHPEMCAKNTYTLKFEQVQHPWIAGYDA